jgi:hypothetical protein
VASGVNEHQTVECNAVRYVRSYEEAVMTLRAAVTGAMVAGLVAGCATMSAAGMAADEPQEVWGAGAGPAHPEAAPGSRLNDPSDFATVATDEPQPVWGAGEGFERPVVAPASPSAPSLFGWTPGGLHDSTPAGISPSPQPQLGIATVLPSTGGPPVMATSIGGNVFLPVTGGPPVIGTRL